MLSLFAGGKAKAAPGLRLQGFYSCCSRVCDLNTSLERKTTIIISRLNILQVPLIIHFLKSISSDVHYHFLRLFQLLDLKVNIFLIITLSILILILKAFWKFRIFVKL